MRVVILLMILLSGCSEDKPVTQKDYRVAVSVCAPNGGFDHFSVSALTGILEVVCSNAAEFNLSVEQQEEILK